VGELTTRRASSRERVRGTTPRPRSGPDVPVQRHPLLELQRQAGNQAVLSLLQRSARVAPVGSVQRAPATHPENPPVTNLHPPGTLSDADWATAFAAARATPSEEAYRPLFRDIARTAGLGDLPGFDLNSIPLTDQKTAKPGLNISLTTSGEPGHTGWIDASGQFGVPLNLTRAKPTVSIGVILTAGALNADKGLSLRTVRHEMVHARHKLKVLDAVRAWQNAPGKQSFDEWLTGQVKRKKMTNLDVALIGKGAKDASANTEVLGYVEGFMHDFHRRPAEWDQGRLSIAELLGAVRTSKLDTWRQADTAVQDEAMARLQTYYGTLDAAHQRLWRELLDDRKAKVSPKDTAKELEFIGRLGAFVVLRRAAATLWKHVPGSRGLLRIPGMGARPRR